MIRSIISAFFLFGATCLNGADIKGTVKGRITDKESGDPLPGVYVLFGKQFGALSDKNGLYEFSTDSLQIKLTFRLIGYKSLTKTVSVSPGATVTLDVSLEMVVGEIGQVVVSANKTEQTIAELSVSMDVVKSAFLSENHITDAQELINRTPGIEVMDGQASIRGGSGFSYGAGSRVLALIDGLPILSADASNIKWQFLPLETISQVEIIKGASSVLYGSSALNGIINFRTRDASNVPETDFYAEVGIYGKPRNKKWIWWDTPRLYSSASFSHLQKFGKTDIDISGNILIDDGYRRLNWEKIGRMDLKIKHFDRKIEGLNYGVSLYSGYNIKKDFVLWEDAITGALKQSPSTAVEYHGTFLSVDPFISYRKNSKFQQDLKMRIQSTFSRLPDRSQNNSDAWSAYAEYQLWYRLFEFLDLTAGASENYSLVTSAFFGDHHEFNVAGYAQVEVKPVNRLKAVAGLRFEQFSLDGVTDRVVPIFRTGLNWQAADYTFLRASFGQGYRFPSIAEKFATTTLGSISIIPNPAIRPESGWSSEIGVKQGIAFGKLKGQADLSAFFLQNSNLIEFMFGAYPEGLGFKASNVEQARIYGFELDYSLGRSFGKARMTLTGGYTFTYPVEYNSITHKNTSTYLKYRRKHNVSTSFTVLLKKYNLGLDLYYRSKILNIDDVFLSTPILPGFAGYWASDNTGYFLLDGSFGYRITGNFTISVAVKNITDTEYMGRPGDIQPQRNYSLRLTGKF
ncbi:MAG: TonB-dependent receptor [Bacteroidales bacterium]